MGAQFAEAAAIAGEQNGRITAAQLRACGFGKGSIEKAVRAGRLHRVHRGVYAVGHTAPNRLSDWHAAVLACGEGAALSHRCAGTLMRMRDGVGPRIDVTIPTSSGRRRPGIHIHHGPLPSYEVGTWSAIPVTSPARTMVDLAFELDETDDIEWTLRQMQFRRLFDRTALEVSLRRRPNRDLIRLLKGLPRTASRLEVAFVNRIVRRHDLPMPVLQADPLGFHVDFLWPDAMLVVETDGSHHDEPSNRAIDAARDAWLEEAGFRVLRFRWADVHRHDDRTARRIREALRVGHP